jgi:hypothetical protein
VNANAGLEHLHAALWSVGLPDNLAARRSQGPFGIMCTRRENRAALVCIVSEPVCTVHTVFSVHTQITLQAHLLF